MDLRRTNLIMEFGIGNAASGMTSPIGVRNFATYPFMPNMELLKQKEAEANRRRERLRELALGWYFTSSADKKSDASGGNSNASLAGGSAGAGPGKLF